MIKNLALLFLLASTAIAETDRTQPIEPPFGLNWGENPTNIKEWIESNKFPSIEGTAKDKRHVIEVEGPFPNAEFNRLRFYFTDDQLNEAELQFYSTASDNEKPQDLDTINNALLIKQEIDKQLGKGKLLKNESGEKEGTKWTFIQQLWTDEEHSIWLAVFTATKPPQQKLSMVSIHYRWETKISKAKP